MKRLIRLALVASVLYGAGMHWTTLQGVAWFSMVATRLSESSWVEAVSSTFSGEKPCGVCKIVEKGSSVDQGPAVIRFAPGLDLAFSVVPRLHAALPVCAPAFLTLRFYPGSSSRPVAPPPKTALPA